jgi:ribosomal protein S24E
VIFLEIKKLSEHENKFIGRKEFRFEVVYAEAPPKRMDIRAEIAKHLNIQPEVVAMTKIKNVFGLQKNIVNVNVYKDVNDAKKFELKHIQRRMGLIGAKKNEPKAAVAPAPKKGGK